MFRVFGVLRVPSWIAFGCIKNDPRVTRNDTKYASPGKLSHALITLISIPLACLSLVDKAHAHPAWGIAVDRQGQVYFSDLTTVWKADAQGRLSVFRAKDDRHIHDLNIDGAGNLYGADNAYEPGTERFFSAIWRMTPAGDFSYLLAPTDDPPVGTSIWRDQAGNSYHASYFPEDQLLVLKRTPNGNVSVLAGNKDTARNYRQGVPYSVGGMSFGPGGALYFVHGANVSKISTTGTLTPLIRDLLIETSSADQAKANSLTQLFGIAVNAQGIAFVADYGNRRVMKITGDSQLTTLLRAEPPWFPTGVACLGNDVYVLEHSFTPAHAPMGTRVRKLSPDGRVTVLASVGELQSPSAGDSSSIESSQTLADPTRSRYLAIGTVIGIFVLAIFIVWGLSRRMYNRRQEQK